MLNDIVKHISFYYFKSNFARTKPPMATAIQTNMFVLRRTVISVWPLAVSCDERIE